MLISVPAIAAIITAIPAEANMLAGMRPIKAIAMNAWYMAEIVLTIKFWKNDKSNGSKNSTTTIPIATNKPAGSSYEMVLGPVWFRAANSIAAIAISRVAKIIRNLLGIIKPLSLFYYNIFFYFSCFTNLKYGKIKCLRI